MNETEGNLVPRKAPRRSAQVRSSYIRTNRILTHIFYAQIEPAYLTSFAEQAKHYNRGHRFGQSEGRLQFKANPGPGPLEYNPSQSDEYLKQSRRGHAVMALSPCKRLTDEIVNEAVKKGVPGPGAYEVKIINESSKKRLNGTMGGEGHKGYLESTQMFSPGPGAYYPEQAERSKPANVKCSTFGSTKKRFDHDKLKYLSETIPAPGSYDLDEINSLAKTVQKRVHVSSTNPAIAFGSFTERFKHQRPQTSTEPGPAAYDLTNSQLEYEVKNGSSKALTTNEIANRRSKERESKLVSLLRRGPRQYQIGNMLIAATQVHIPVFGTQTERFPSNVDKDIPPPGTYEIEEAFKNLKTKGKLEKTSTLSSLAKRELFKGMSFKCIRHGSFSQSRAYQLPSRFPDQASIILQCQRRASSS